MERNQKKVKVDLRSRKSERRLLRSCFGNFLFSLVPFEIWRDIVSNADLKTIILLSQTCWGFKELVDNIGENNFNLALLLRREGEIALAKKYLFACANNNDPMAMFYVGFAYDQSSEEEDKRKSAEWYKKSAELGNAHAMAFFSYWVRYGIGMEHDDELSIINVWAQKALSSNNSFAIGFCHYSGLGTLSDNDKAYSYFVASAEEGDEFGQHF